MHYVPARVHPEEGQKAEEVFIWTGADYDPHTDLLAVTGCIWACPYSTIVLDFSCPLQPHPRSVGWICGISLTRTMPGLTILSLSAGKATACFFGAATQRMTGGKKFECQWSS